MAEQETGELGRYVRNDGDGRVLVQYAIGSDW